MKMNEKVTVIMAVYNAEEYLHESIGSLLNQTYKELEIICVDDCSTDGSKAILEDYARKDARIRVLSTGKNSGAAAARNKAVEAMTGTLTTFLDADDWMSEDAIEKAVTTFHDYPDTDCVLFTCIMQRPDGTQYPYPQEAFEVKTGYDAFKDSLTWAIHGIYMARESLYRQHPYDTTCRTFSDDNTTRLHYYISRAVRTCEGKYYYRYNPDGISHNNTISRLDYLRASESLRLQLSHLSVNNDVLRIYECQHWLIIIDAYYFYFSHRSHFSAGERKYCLSEIRRAWKGVNVSFLPLGLRCKFGYVPFRFSWFLFRCQEEIYFFLRSLFRR